MNGHGFLGEASPSDGADRLFAADVERLGYVMNLSRVWAHLPDADQAVRGLLELAVTTGSLTYRQEPSDVQALRDAGFDDTQVFAVTLFVAMRLAFATVNDALGALPDAQLAKSVPSSLLDAVDFGRPLAPPEE